jgi:hypothetical protein
LSLCYELEDILESEGLIEEGYDLDFCQFLVALSNNCSENPKAFNFLQLAAESLDYVYGDSRTLPSFRAITKAILDRTKQCEKIEPAEKISMFRDMYNDDLHWARPLCAVIMALEWDLTPSSMDECIESYLSIRNESEDAWSEDYDAYHYANWMPLFALAVLNSTWSERVIDAVDLTSRTSSALPLWVWLSIFEKQSRSGSLKGSQLEGWYPEILWRDSVFFNEEVKVKINQENWFTLLAMYFENHENWLWSYDWVNVDKDNLDEHLESLL